MHVFLENTGSGSFLKRNKGYLLCFLEILYSCVAIFIVLLSCTSEGWCLISNIFSTHLLMKFVSSQFDLTLRFWWQGWNVDKIRVLKNTFFSFLSTYLNILIHSLVLQENRWNTENLIVLLNIPLILVLRTWQHKRNYW